LLGFSVVITKDKTALFAMIGRFGESHPLTSEEILGYLVMAFFCELSGGC